MARATEKIALELMKAFAAEHKREPDATKCRTAGAIATALQMPQEEFDRAMEFVGPRRERLINGWRRSDGLAVQPNEKGYAWIASHKERWTLDRRLVLYGIIIGALISALVALWQR